MTQARGYLGRLVLDFETTFGSNPVTAAGKKLPFNSLEVSGSQNLIDPATITGTRNPVAPGKGNLSVDGGITIPMDLNAIGYWLKAMFGAPTTTGAGPYTHVFKVGSSQPSVVLEKGFTDIGQYMLYNGCKISTFKTSFGGDGELTAQMDIMGAKETIGATEYDATPDAVELNRLNNFQASLKEGGVAFATATSGDFNLDFGLDGDQYTIGANGARGDIPEGILNITGSLKTLFADATLLNKGVNGTKSSLEVAFTLSADASLTFLFPEIVYERKTPPISGPAGVSTELGWRAFFGNDVNASAVVVTLKNSIASY